MGEGVTAEGDTVTSTALSGSGLKTAVPGLQSGLNASTFRDVSGEGGNQVTKVGSGSPTLALVLSMVTVLVPRV